MEGEAGCFVFEVLRPIGLRCSPSIEDQYRIGPRKGFTDGDMVSVDLILQDEAEVNTGPFLRLSDGSGWLFVQKEGLVYLREVPIEKGLWTFYVDNEPSGLGPDGLVIRNHPMDQLQEPDSEIVLQQTHGIPILLPMQKIFCDRRVQGIDGVNFYRLQGTMYPSWVFDKRIQGEDRDVQYLMHPEDRVQSGLFAYRALQDLAIRHIANVDENVSTTWTVRQNEVIVCDIVKESPYRHGNGPFLRLADGTGWLFEHQKGERMMVQVSIEEGNWKLQIEKAGGIRLRKQPIGETRSFCSTEYPEKEILNCDRKIEPQIPGQATFYRVKGTNGWIFDKRGNEEMASVLEEANQTVAPEDEEEGWSVGFVRGVALAVAKGLEEVGFNYHGRVVSFRHPEGARINVYYATRTIGTCLEQGKAQVFRRNCTREELVEILRSPKIHTGRGYGNDSNPNQACNQSTTDHDIDMEEEFRNRLKVLDEEISGMLEQRRTILDSIRVHGRERFRRNAMWWKEKFDHDKVLHSDIAAQLEAKRLQEEAEILRLYNEQRRRELEHRLLDCTCTFCGRDFVNPHAMQTHVRDAHGPRWL